jgi:hypothetical protein
MTRLSGGARVEMGKLPRRESRALFMFAISIPAKN